MTSLTGGVSDTPPNLSNIDHRLTLAFGGLIFTLMVVVLLASSWYLRGVMEREQDRLATLTTQVLTNAVSRVSFSGKYHARELLAKPGIQGRLYRAERRNGEVQAAISGMMQVTTPTS